MVSEEPGGEGLPGADAPDALVTALRRWRLEEAKRQKVPAFRVLADRTLLALAALKPRSDVDLLNVGGIGPTRLEKYGARLLEIVRSLAR